MRVIISLRMCVLRDPGFKPAPPPPVTIITHIMQCTSNSNFLHGCACGGCLRAMEIAGGIALRCATSCRSASDVIGRELQRTVLIMNVRESGMLACLCAIVKELSRTSESAACSHTEPFNGSCSLRVILYGAKVSRVRDHTLRRLRE